MNNCVLRASFPGNFASVPSVLTKEWVSWVPLQVLDEIGIDIAAQVSIFSLSLFHSASEPTCSGQVMTLIVIKLGNRITFW